MKVIRKAKENLFILLIAAAYIAMFIINQNMGIASIKNSFYYIKEMIMIMPVIFVLTALLDLCKFRKNCASVPEERSAIPLQTEQSSAG